MIELLRSQGVPTLLSVIMGINSLKDINCSNLTNMNNSKIIEQKNFYSRYIYSELGNEHKII